MAIDRITNNRIDAIELILTGKIQDTTVNYAVDVNIILTSVATGGYQITQTNLDGMPITQGKRYLLLNQTNKAENGIYVVQSLNPVTLTRPYDFYYFLNIHNTRAQVLEGTKQEEFFLITTTEPFTLGITEIIVTATERQPDVLTMLNSKLDNSVAKLVNQSSTPSASIGITNVYAKAGELYILDEQGTEKKLAFEGSVLTLLNQKLDNSVANLNNQANTPTTPTANTASVYTKGGELYILNDQGVESKFSLDALQNKASINTSDKITIKDSEDGYVNKNITANALTDGGTF